MVLATSSPGIVTTSGRMNKYSVTSVDTKAISHTTAGHGGQKTLRNHLCLMVARQVCPETGHTLLGAVHSVYRVALVVSLRFSLQMAEVALSRGL
jgi:hypothetical protein